MRHIRIGKDISLRWSILTDGAAIPLEGRDLTLEMKSPIGKVIILPYRVDGNVLTMTYYGYEQNVVGEYSLTLWENKGKPGQNVVDAIRAFKLVRTSPEEADFTGGDLQVESVDLGTANLEILSGGGASTPGENPDLSALEGKVAANTASISKINEELDIIKVEQDGHDNSIAQINTKLGEHTDSISELKSSSSLHGTSIDAINAQVHSQGKSIGSIEGKLSEHSESIRQASIAIEGNSSSIADIRAKHNSDVDAINDILDEHTQSINATSDVVSGHTSEITSIKSKQTEQNNRLDDHEERLVYTESDLVKVREEYNGIISELVKSIGHIQKTFEVETNDSEGYIYIDGAKKTIPANSIKGFRFNKGFNSNVTNNSGIASFRFLVTDTSEITDTRYMFYVCRSLTSLDVSNFDTSNVTNMGYMFGDCRSLTSLDVSNFDTSNVTNMGYMFGGCRSLTSLDVSNFDTSNVTNMGQMFYDCRSLTPLDVSNFDTSNVTNMGYMFAGVGSLTSLLLGPNFFKTSAVTIIDFSDCSKWTNETVVTSLVTNSYDRAAAGLNTLTIKLHANTKAALSDEQKATITSKGYTIA